MSVLRKKCDEQEKEIEKLSENESNTNHQLNNTKTKLIDKEDQFVQLQNEVCFFLK